MYGLTEREKQADRTADGDLTFLERLARVADEGNAALADAVRLPAAMPTIDDYLATALDGGFPRLAFASPSARGRQAWLTSYLDDLLTRDAAIEAKDPIRLRRYFEVLALNLAGAPSDSTLYQAAGVNARTAAGYDRLLENLYAVESLPAWATNRLTALVQTKKRYVVDPALAATALGLGVAALLADPVMLGRFFDALGVAQLRPEVALAHPPMRLEHLRTQAGRQEVDLVVRLDHRRVIGIEFKASAAPEPRDARHLEWFREHVGPAFALGLVLHAGPAVYPLAERVWAVPMCALWR
jgi:uncharacterized protein